MFYPHFAVPSSRVESLDRALYHPLSSAEKVLFQAIAPRSALGHHFLPHVKGGGVGGGHNHRRRSLGHLRKRTDPPDLFHEVTVVPPALGPLFCNCQAPSDEWARPAWALLFD